ncbi:DUF221-domain-containing protein [Lepidopterella palustris CBS 459.81]|uniref:DUF221-domain-containing protein n=1 Tax=Lepidopterella palustris CBS 459.81 TaxID=1314670 RepID=A0A8E2EDE6_9PEZI|nr:DUF221-domain-containing protein [Lepidopterella palustris CBS 459.81]
MEAIELLGRQSSSTNQSNDPNIGSAQGGSNSASAVVSTLTPVLLIAVVWFAAFLFLRRKFKRRYSPRSFLSILHEGARTPELPDSLVGWIPTFWSIPDTHVLQHHSLDGFLLLRLLKICVVSCFVGCLITWPVLFPVDATGGAGKTQFDLLTMANISNNYYRYFAHAGCAYLFFGFIMFMITRESIYYINLRQAFLMSHFYAARLSSRTVLFTSVPDEYLDEKRLRDVFGPQVRKIWIPTDTKELDDMVEERDKTSLKLEASEVKLIKLANKARVKSQKGSDGNVGQEEEQVGDHSASGSVAARWIRPKDRPTHRLKPLIGKKVDSIDWCRSNLETLIPKVEAEQAKHRGLEAKKVNAVFIEFTSVVEAQIAYQSLAHHQPLHMSPRFTGMSPEEVIWSNLKIQWYSRVIRGFATTGAVVATIIFWSIPVAFVASISHVDALIKVLPWLSFINKIPKAILGVVTGLLPVVLLAVLMALLPIYLRLMARLKGDPTKSAVELSVQSSYFGFQVVQVFLVATLGSAASAAVGDIIKNPTDATTLLATTLPTASTFYLSYFILQGLGVVSGMLVGLVGLVISKVLSLVLDTTPRKMYKRWASLSGLGWGTVFPVYTNLFVIAICYACIAPMVLFFAGAGLWFFWFAYRYNLLYVYDADIDTKGLCYPKALQHLFVGLYIAELCLIGLFAIKANTPGGLGSLIMMIILLVFTILYNSSLSSALDPLLGYLPKTLEAEERSLLAAENAETVIASDDQSTPGVESKTEKAATTTTGLPPAPHKKPNFLVKFLKPHIYQDYATMRRLVPRDFGEITYAPEIERDAYFPPSVKSPPMLIWIPSDKAGVSKQEVKDTAAKGIPITDDGASFDDKGKIVWGQEPRTAPIYEEKVFY